MNPTDKDQYGSLAPLLADVFHDILNFGVLKKVASDNNIGVERVGDSRDAGMPSRAAASSLVKLVPLETRMIDRPPKGPASVPLNSPSKEQRKKSILTAESKKNPECKEKHRQRLRLLFAPDEEVVEPARSQPAKPKTQLTPRANVDILEARLNALSKRLLTMETKFQEMNKRQLTLEANMDMLCVNTPF